MQLFIQRLYLVLVLQLSITILVNAQKSYLLVGTYTKGKSEGIYVYDFDTATGTGSYLSTTKSSNPSFITIVNNKFVYAVNENDTGTITAYKFINGKLTFINAKPSNGKHPCYISSRQWMNSTSIIAGNYSSGNFILYNTDSSGALTNVIETVQHYGSSVNAARQKSPHVHATVVSASNQCLYVPDLGIDKVMIYRFDAFGAGLYSTKPSFNTSKAGSGPRHLSFHPTKRFAYLMEELSGTVKVLKVKANGKLKSKQIISSYPNNYNGIIGSADIHVSPNGKFLYTSNRGDANSIAIFSINQKNGKLKAVGFQSTLGIKPRNFNFTPNGKFLLVANQETNNIIIFKVDAINGLLVDTGNRIDVPNPVCLAWIEE